MISSIKHYSSPSFTSPQSTPKRVFTSPPKLPSLPSLSTKQPLNCNVSIHKPLFLSPIQGFGSFSSRKPPPQTVCKAFEAEKSQPLDLNIEAEAAQRLKISLYFATWWALNVVFNIYNKKVLNAFPYPWLTSTLSLAAGSLIMLVSWATRIAEAPKTDLEFWKTLFPVWRIYCLITYRCYIYLRKLESGPRVGTVLHAFHVYKI